MKHLKEAVTGLFILLLSSTAAANDKLLDNTGFADSTTIFILMATTLVFVLLVSAFKTKLP